MSGDRQNHLAEQVRAAFQTRQPLVIRGGGSKSFYGRAVEGRELDISQHSGITGYTPSELVISARAGTPLTELQQTLAASGQMLAFEPPHFGSTATLGGTIACGLSGPRRPYAGAARDFVLGANCLNGKGEYLRFGGQVMKNVAGYDIARLLAGSLGTLAVLLEVHLKVLPLPQREITLLLDVDAAQGLRRCNEWTARALPLSAASHQDGQLLLRLSGTEQGVVAAAGLIGGEQLDSSNRYWERLREHQLSFFDTDRPLWRLSLPPASEPVELEGDWLIDWAGAQRWLKSDAPATEIRAAALRHGGHATLFRNGDRSSEIFQPLPAPLWSLQRRIRQGFDPAEILNPGRMYAGI